MNLALLCPGQGSQHVGMGKALAESHAIALETFQEADEVLGFGLSRLMWEGPEDELTLTQNAQPALLTHSVSALRCLGDAVGSATVAAGHSLGEYSALVAAGSLAFADAVALVRLRGELMSAAGAEQEGTMAAVLGLDDEQVEALCESVTEGVCVPANFNTPGQVVVSGDRAGIEGAKSRAAEFGAKKVIELNVSGAFHSPLMAPAASGLAERLESVQVSDALIPVISNVTAAPGVLGEEAKALLVRQLTAPVRWSASIARMLEDGVDQFVELGPGSVLCGLNRRNARGVPCASVGTPEDVDSFSALIEG